MKKQGKGNSLRGSEGGEVLNLLGKCRDAMKLAENRCPYCSIETSAAAYIDQQLDKAIRYLASARALAVGSPISGTGTVAAACDSWSMDDEIGLGPVALGKKSKGGGA